MTAATVIVPTRNEAGNAEALTARATAALHAGTIDAGLLFVDDSDDGTYDVLRGVRGRYPGVEAIHRPPHRRAGGLAGAVLDGIAAARTDVVAVMDGDLQHPPELLSALLDPVIGGEADIAMATRYAGGGRRDGLGGPLRRAVSQASRRAVALALPDLRAVSDPLGGYFALRRPVVEGAALRGVGFKVLLEILAGGDWERAVEIPYHFQARHSGRSEATLATGLCFAAQLARLTMSARAAPRRVS